jgi:nucleoside-diphosphate-sugar epimerase
MKIFLTGASGFVGSNLIKYLEKQGHEFIAPLRRANQSDEPENRRSQAIDLLDLDLLKKELISVDAVIHCAAMVSTWGLEKDFQDTNIRITNNLVEAAKHAGVKKFIHMSCASVVMDKPQGLFDINESMPLCHRLEFPYSRSKAQAEKIVLHAGSAEFKTIALRPSFLWGKGDIVDRQIGMAARLGKFGWFNQGEYLYATCYIENLQEAVCKALQTERFNEAYFISDGKAITYRSFMEKRLRAGGYPVPSFSISNPLAWVLAKFTENGWKYLPLRGNPPLTREMVRITGYPLTVNIEKAYRELGYEPPYTFEQALEKLDLTA